MLCRNVIVDETVYPSIEPQLGQGLPSGPGVITSPQFLQVLVKIHHAYSPWLIILNVNPCNFIKISNF